MDRPALIIQELLPAAGCLTLASNTISLQFANLWLF